MNPISLRSARPEAPGSRDPTVRSTLTGKALATVTPPASLGTFSLVDGTASPETFLVGAQPWHPASGSDNSGNSAQPVTLYLLHYDPATRAARLAPVPLPALPGSISLPALTGRGPTGTEMTSVAISPDGTRLAVVYQSVSKGTRIRTWITVYVLDGQNEPRAWSAPGSVKMTFDGHSVMQATNIIGTPSWSADDATLAFPLIGQHGGVYLLNTAAAGTSSLLSASRLVVPLTGQQSNGDFVCYDGPRLLANGADVLCGGYTIPAGWSIEAKGFPKGQVTQGFGEFSVTTGRLVAILGQVRAPISLAASPANPYQQETNAGNFPFLLWASADAQVTIGLTDGGHAVLVRDGRTRRLPWPLSIAIPYDSAAPGAAW